jgi:hypothetical protein
MISMSVTLIDRKQDGRYSVFISATYRVVILNELKFKMTKMS